MALIIHFKKYGFIIGFTAIVVINLIVFSPSLDHIPRSDHILYLNHFSGVDDFKTLAIDAYDFNRRNPWVEKKSTLLFRPITYFVLGVEKWLFGYDFRLWQMTGIVMHLIVVGLLFAVLLKIHRSIAAFFMTLFFSVIFSNMEMVIWHHINSYMIFVAWFLLILLMC